MLSRTCFLVFLNLILLNPLLARDLNLHDLAILYVKKANVATFERGLPDLSFQEWLSELFRGRAQIRWEVNDCYEPTLPTVDPGMIAKELEWERPLCVEAMAAYPNETRFSIRVAAGTWGKTVERQPRIREISLQHATRHGTISVWFLTRLKELERFVRTEPWKQFD